MKPTRYGKSGWTGWPSRRSRRLSFCGSIRRRAPRDGSDRRGDRPDTLDNPAEFWSGGRIVLRRDNVVIPRNLLIDLPANRLTLQQLFAQAPPACLANGEPGLAKADRCNPA